MITFADGSAEARVAARYADFDPAEMHRVQIAHNRRNAAPAIRKASERSIDYLCDLSEQRTDVSAEVARRWAESVDYSEVNAKINWLRTLQYKRAEAAPEVPAGRYAVDGDKGQTVFVKVDRPTEGNWAGRTFVSVQAGDEMHPVRYEDARNGLLRKILADGLEAASVRYGRELGVCGRCGRTLTDEESRAAGIGPVCAAKGW